jgi:hypothetical protein
MYVTTPPQVDEVDVNVSNKLAAASEVSTSKASPDLSDNLSTSSVVMI